MVKPMPDHPPAPQRARRPSLDNSAVVLGDLRIDQLAAQRFGSFEPAFLVRPISGKDRAKAAGLLMPPHPQPSAAPTGTARRAPGCGKD